MFLIQKNNEKSSTCALNIVKHIKQHTKNIEKHINNISKHRKTYLQHRKTVLLQYQEINDLSKSHCLFSVGDLKTLRKTMLMDNQCPPTTRSKGLLSVLARMKTTAGRTVTATSRTGTDTTSTRNCAKKKKKKRNKSDWAKIHVTCAQLSTSTFR